MEPGAAVPPGHGGLCAGGHPDALGDLHPLLQAGQQVLAGGDGLPPLGHRLHRQPTDHGAKRRPRPARRR